LPLEKFAEAAPSHKADIVALLAPLTVTMPAMKTTVDAFVQAGLRDSARIIVGGAPVTAHSARQSGRR
jgi:5-methyltetrahydrofolate--homocysteine methyltransferase